MAVFLVSYDLVNEGKGTHDYQPLWDAMDKLGAQKTQYSLYLLNVNNTAKEIREHFQKLVDSDDRIWVTRIRRGQYDYGNAISGTNAWMEKNPPEA
ncbi:CRISPR-associated endonuclease Cas2 [Chelatococcus sp. YT9]|uniref:CRISPR-associated endonuclease Cas2 n=1 Tax=Chelatococcus sp. YT9 TaxID=2835635 RepID=UPI001BCBF9C5|nr:CRISPR-associated endonuclease Cas2 [Chelatococcus sp. YT9]MBS7698604.1 CRISPR-associated endonuclease Cas2 [Chelatococcus sp. YT9]